jgi:hypothetical protein
MTSSSTRRCVDSTPGGRQRCLPLMLNHDRGAVAFIHQALARLTGELA